MSTHRPDSALHPSEGARFLFERIEVAADDARAVYRATVYTPSAKFGYLATVHLDGAYEVRPDAGGAAADLEQKLDMQARLLARGASKRQSDALPTWPHRVLRWKGPGRG